MKRIDLKNKIENYIQEINTFKTEDNYNVVLILKNCLNDFMNLEDIEFRNEIDSKNFIKSRNLIKIETMNVIKNIEENNKPFLSNNFFQAKTSLSIIIDCLNVQSV